MHPVEKLNEVSELSENPNSSWANFRGSWVVNLILLGGTKLFFSSFFYPMGASAELVWTLTTLTYNIITLVMFHSIIGTPFDYDQNKYESYTLWEQLDNGTQFTPTRKFLTSVPILLFITGTHFTRYNLLFFSINFTVTLISVIAKLPSMHRVRFFGFNKGASDDIKNE